MYSTLNQYNLPHFYLTLEALHLAAGHPLLAHVTSRLVARSEPNNPPWLVQVSNSNNNNNSKNNNNNNNYKNGQQHINYNNKNDSANNNNDNSTEQQQLQQQ